MAPENATKCQQHDKAAEGYRGTLVVVERQITNETPSISEPKVRHYGELERGSERE